MTIKLNPDEVTVVKIREAIKKNGGYCPCVLQQTPDTKCMCKDFKENVEEGYCHCGLYYKTKE